MTKFKTSTPAAYGRAFGAAEGVMTTIKQGDADSNNNGFAVTALAGNLNAQSYEGKNENVLKEVLAGLLNPANKGKFTEGLSKQVKKFQAAKGLTADGIVGPGTWKALGLKGTEPARKYVPAAAPAAAPAAQAPAEEPGITSSAFFWPGVILGATAIGAGTYFIFFSK